MTITTAAALAAALRKCSGGETIDEGLAINEPVPLAGFRFARPVTIRGGYIAAGGLVNDWDSILRADNCGGLRFEGLTIRGTQSAVNGNLGRSMFLKCADMAMVGCDVGQSHRALQVANTTGLLIERNDFHDLRSDGVNLAAVSAAVLRQNSYRIFRPIGSDHADAIQGWSAGVTADLDDILIEDECIEGDPLDRPQGIFLSDAIKGHTRIIIRRVLLTNTLWQGVQAQQCPGVVLDGVRLLSEAGGQVVPGGPVVPWIAVPADAKVTDCAAPRWIVKDAAGKSSYAAPAGGVAAGASSREAVDAALADWAARFRPKAVEAPKPTMADVLALLDQAREMIAAM